MQKTAIAIVQALQNAGFEAYFAGGSVRDMLMGGEPADYDIATSARPEEIEKLLPKTIPVGRQFGVMLAVMGEHTFEIATFRSDSASSDGRRPDAVFFTSAKEDAVRRDFTINGLFYDPLAKKVLDYVGGQKDIQAKVLRFIGEPHERVKEDHLRLLRAVRFKNHFDFRYEAATQKALAELSHLVDGISKERVSDELTKMLLSPRRSHALRELDTFGMLERILPEVTAGKGIKQPHRYHQEGDVFTHLLKSLHELPSEALTAELAWAVLLHDIGKPLTFEQKPDRIHFDGHAALGAQMAKRVCTRLKFSRAMTAKICWLIEHHMTVGFIPQMRPAHRAALFWHPWFPDLMCLHHADESGSVPADLRLYEAIMKLYSAFKDTRLLPAHFEPLLSGNDLIRDFKLRPGPAIKEILATLKEEQIEGRVKTKAQAKAMVKKILKLS